MENNSKKNKKSLNKDKVEESEFETHNTYYDISGNMNIWRVHETYSGTGNYSLWDDIIKEKSKKPK